MWTVCLMSLIDIIISYFMHWKYFLVTILTASSKYCGKVGHKSNNSIVLTWSKYKEFYFQLITGFVEKSRKFTRNSFVKPKRIFLLTLLSRPQCDYFPYSHTWRMFGWFCPILALMMKVIRAIDGAKKTNRSKECQRLAWPMSFLVSRSLLTDVRFENPEPTQSFMFLGV